MHLSIVVVLISTVSVAYWADSRVAQIASDFAKDKCETLEVAAHYANALTRERLENTGRISKRFEQIVSDIDALTRERFEQIASDIDALIGERFEQIESDIHALTRERFEQIESDITRERLENTEWISRQLESNRKLVEEWMSRIESEFQKYPLVKTPPLKLVTGSTRQYTCLCSVGWVFAFAMAQIVFFCCMCSDAVRTVLAERR